LDHTAPVGVESDGALRPDSVSPVIFVCEAATGPANIRHLQRLQRRNYVVADPARIGNGRVRTYPYALIDSMTQMFGELAKNVAVNFGACLRDVDCEFNFLRSRKRNCTNQQKE